MTCVWHLNEARKKLHETFENTHDMFPVGTQVVIICIGQDQYFFSGDELGTVIRNTGEYLGVEVEFYEPRYFKGTGQEVYVQRKFNFNPSDLVSLEFEV